MIMMTMTHCNGCREFHKFVMLKKLFVLRDGQTSIYHSNVFKKYFYVEWNIRPIYRFDYYRVLKPSLLELRQNPFSRPIMYVYGGYSV